MDSQAITRLLEAVDACASLAEAASRLRVSVPTLAERMKALEAHLPFAPFATMGRRKVLTEFGRRLLDSTRPAADALDAALHDALARETHPARSTIRLAGRAEILARFARGCDFPGTVALEPCSSMEASRRVRDRECDFAISHAPPAHSSLVSRKLFVSGWALYLPPGKRKGDAFAEASTRGAELPPRGDPAWRFLCAPG